MRADHRPVLAAVVAAGLFAAGDAAAQATANAQLINPDGKAIGNVSLTEIAAGVRIFAQATNLEPGVHAFHIHETGACEPPEFTSAGGHFNPAGAEHGWDNPNGPHAGDFPNVHVQNDGILAIEYFTDTVTLGEGEASLFDDDGSAIVMHQGADDYQTDPAGAAGPRIACGVIEK